MPRIFIDAFGNRTPFTPGGARIWLQRAGVNLSPSLDAWLPQFLGSGTRAYGFLRSDQFVRDLERWLEIHSFASGGSRPSRPGARWSSSTGTAAISR